jgi:2-oxoadipate dioxygenase/decarboxylase-like protein
VTGAELLDVLWRDHIASAPQVARIHQVLTQRGELLRHDHLAFATFCAPDLGLGIDALARPFEALGWRPCERYRCHHKHVRARSWQHADPALPRLFLSELTLDELTPGAQALIGRLVEQVPAGFGDRADLLWAGRPWRITHAEYLALDAESTQAAWVAAFGARVHHFTVDVDSLATFPDLEALAAFLVEHGFRFDDRGGLIRGSRAEQLEQAAIRAELVPVTFADATVRIPCGRYELARRYPLPSGEPFHGFLAPPAEPVRAPAGTEIAI